MCTACQNCMLSNRVPQQCTMFLPIYCVSTCHAFLRLAGPGYSCDPRSFRCQSGVFGDDIHRAVATVSTVTQSTVWVAIGIKETGSGNVTMSWSYGATSSRTPSRSFSSSSSQTPSVTPSPRVYTDPALIACVSSGVTVVELLDGELQGISELHTGDTLGQNFIGPQSGKCANGAEIVTRENHILAIAIPEDQPLGGTLFVSASKEYVHVYIGTGCPSTGESFACETSGTNSAVVAGVSARLLYVIVGYVTLYPSTHDTYPSTDSGFQLRYRYAPPPEAAPQYDVSSFAGWGWNDPLGAGNGGARAEIGVNKSRIPEGPRCSPGGDLYFIEGGTLGHDALGPIDVSFINSSTGELGRVPLPDGLKPVAIAVVGDGTLYAVDTASTVARAPLIMPTLNLDTSTVYRFSVTGDAANMVTVAGTGLRGNAGDGGPATSANLALAVSLGIDIDGSLLILSLYGHRLRRVDLATGVISTVAGGGAPTYEYNASLQSSGDGGPASSARLAFPRDVAIDTRGHIFIGSSSRIQRIDRATSIITTIAGGGETPLYLAGGYPALSVSMLIWGLALTPDGDPIFSGENAVYLVRVADGILYRLAGNYNQVPDGMDKAVVSGLATDFPLAYVGEVATDRNGTVYLVDGVYSESHARIVKLESTLSSATVSSSASVSATPSNTQSVGASASTSCSRGPTPSHSATGSSTHSWDRGAVGFSSPGGGHLGAASRSCGRGTSTSTGVLAVLVLVQLLCW